MKNNIQAILFTAILGLISGVCQSQASAGDFVFGGGSGFKQTTTGSEFSDFAKSRESRFEAVLPVGYFILNNLAVGVAPTYERSFEFREPDSQQKSELLTNSFIGNIFIKKYFLNAQIRPFISATGGFGIRKSANMYFDGGYSSISTSEYTSKNYGGEIGVAYFPNEKVSLELFFGVRKSQGIKLLSRSETFFPSITTRPIELEFDDFEEITLFIGGLKVFVFF